MPSREYDNQGAIWKNEERETDKHPHFKGEAMLNGVEYWVSAFKRSADAKPKAPALKFYFKPKDARPAQESSPQDDFDDDIGF